MTKHNIHIEEKDNELLRKSKSMNAESASFKIDCMDSSDVTHNCDRVEKRKKRSNNRRKFYVTLANTITKYTSIELKLI